MSRETFKLLCSIFGIDPKVLQGWMVALFSYLPGGTGLFLTVFYQPRLVALIQNRHVLHHIGHSVANKSIHIL